MRPKTDDEIFAQGALSFRMIIPTSSNPFKTPRERKIWENGYKREEFKWGQNNKPRRTYGN